MENQLYIIISISVAFLFFMGTIIILAKKNVFSSNTTTEKNKMKVKSNDKYDSLIKEVEKLKTELEGYQIQNEELLAKINELEEHVADLKKQKNLLIESKKKIESLQKEKNDLFATVVHDIKNPASAIQGFVKLLESYDITTKDQQEIMEGLFNTSNRIIRLVEDVTKVLEAEREMSEIIFTEYQMNNIVDTVCSRYSGVIKSKDLSLKVNKAHDLPFGMMDDNKIDHVIDNLINNAIKFSPPKTEIEIKTFKEGKYIVVEVKDNGYGLNQEDLAKAFEKGGKLSNRPTAGESSTGLGLWIVKRIVEEHHGRVWVKSSKGFGSTFAFRIPIKHEEILEVA